MCSGKDLTLTHAIGDRASIHAHGQRRKQHSVLTLALRAEPLPNLVEHDLEERLSVLTPRCLGLWTMSRMPFMKHLAGTGIILMAH